MNIHEFEIGMARRGKLVAWRLDDMAVQFGVFYFLRTTKKFKVAEVFTCEPYSLQVRNGWEIEKKRF
jgi:hypothetical protein